MFRGFNKFSNIHRTHNSGLQRQQILKVSFCPELSQYSNNNAQDEGGAGGKPLEVPGQQGKEHKEYQGCNKSTAH